MIKLADFTVNNIVFGSYMVLMLVLGFIIWRASRDPKNNYRFSDLLVEPKTKRGSLTRTLQLIAGLTGTFVVMFQTVKSGISFDVLGVYLFAMGLAEGWNKFMQYKTAALAGKPVDGTVESIEVKTDETRIEEK